MATVRELLDPARRQLAAAGVERPAREAALLLRTLLEMSEAALLAHERSAVAPEVERRFLVRVERRALRVPAAYLLGEREFFGRPFHVDERVLIPRPETEELVRLALELPLPERCRVLELACGSGCVAVTLAVERPRWRVVASDLSPAALAVTRLNLRRHAVASRVALVAADLARGLDLRDFDLVVANPPYVARSERATLAPEVRDHEPELALYADDDGLTLYDRLLAELRALPPRAWLACEHGAGQGEALVRRAEAAGGWQLADRRRDLAGLDRNLLWRRSA